jgi:hypothetical protein
MVVCILKRRRANRNNARRNASQGSQGVHATPLPPSFSSYVSTGTAAHTQGGMAAYDHAYDASCRLHGREPELTHSPNTRVPATNDDTPVCSPPTFSESPFYVPEASESNRPALVSQEQTEDISDPSPVIEPPVSAHQTPLVVRMASSGEPTVGVEP